MGVQLLTEGIRVNPRNRSSAAASKVPIRPSAATGSSGNPITVSQTLDLTTMPLDVMYYGLPPCSPGIGPLSAQVLQPADWDRFHRSRGQYPPEP